MVNMEESAAKRLGEAVRRLREERQWSKNQLATYAHVSRPWVSQVEAGHYKEPSPVRLMRVARVLGVDPLEWLREIDPRLPRLIRERQADLSPDVMDMALRVDMMEPGKRSRLIQAMQAILRVMESGIGQEQKRVAEGRPGYDADQKK